MLCTEKGFMVQAQYGSEWSSYGIARLFDSFVPSRLMIEGTSIGHFFPRISGMKLKFEVRSSPRQKITGRTGSGAKELDNTKVFSG